MGGDGNYILMKCKYLKFHLSRTDDLKMENEVIIKWKCINWNCNDGIQRDEKWNGKRMGNRAARDYFRYCCRCCCRYSPQMNYFVQPWFVLKYTLCDTEWLLNLLIKISQFNKSTILWKTFSISLLLFVTLFFSWFFFVRNVCCFHKISPNSGWNLIHNNL